MVRLTIKKLSDNIGDVREESLIPGLGRSPGGGHGNPIYYSFFFQLLNYLYNYKLKIGMNTVEIKCKPMKVMPGVRSAAQRM